MEGWENSNIYDEQRYGPDTQFRRNKALEARKNLKAAGTIGAGFVQYPAKLLVKQYPHNKNEKYKLYEDFSTFPVPVKPPESYDEE